MIFSLFDIAKFSIVAMIIETEAAPPLNKQLDCCLNHCLGVAQSELLC